MEKLTKQDRLYRKEVIEAIKTLEAINPSVFYTALAIYEWSDIRKPSARLCQKMHDLTDSFDTIYDEYVRDEGRDIMHVKMY